MKKHEKIVLNIVFTSVPLLGYCQTPLNYTIAKWYDNKKAASSLTFDDAISGQFTEAIPLLDANNIKGTFFLTSQNVLSQLGGWPIVLKASKTGHEIANHSVTHSTLSISQMLLLTKSLKTATMQFMPTQK